MSKTIRVWISRDTTYPTILEVFDHKPEKDSRGDFPQSERLKYFGLKLGEFAQFELRRVGKGKK